MRLERQHRGDVTILRFVGEFGAFNLPTFSSEIDNLIETGNVKLVFNLRLMTFINSSALGYLVQTKRRVEEAAGALVIITPSKFVRKALTVLGLHEYFKMFETEEEGVIFFRKGEDATAMDLSNLEADANWEPIGEDAIMLRLFDEEGNSILGHARFIGKITTLYENGLLFRLEIPAEGGRSKLHTGNFDEMVQPGRAISVKFRQPFTAKTKYLKADAAILKVNKEIKNEGVTNAMIHIEFTEIDPNDCELLSV